MDAQSIGSVAATTGATSGGPGVAEGRTAAVAHVDAPHHAPTSTKASEAPPARDPRSLSFQVDGETHNIVATIVDESSKKVIRQIPDAELVRIARAIDRMQGFLVEEKA